MQNKKNSTFCVGKICLTTMYGESIKKVRHADVALREKRNEYNDRACYMVESGANASAFHSRGGCHRNHNFDGYRDRIRVFPT